LLTVSLTRAPGLSSVFGFGFCEITRPFFTFAENARLTSPTEQSWDLSARFTAFRRSPFVACQENEPRF